MTEASSNWLQEKLSQLLASPYIHFTRPQNLGLGLRMGPGPIDLFSTRFTNMFAEDATGVLNGQQVDRAALKEGLLKIQKKFDKDKVTFEPHEQSTSDNHPKANMEWVRRDTGSKVKISAVAQIRQEEDRQRVVSLKVDGDADLFE